MGRYVRPVLRMLAVLPDIALTLLVRDPRELPYYRTLVGESIVTAPPAAVNAGTRFACVWYPWNGMRFASRAPAIVTLNDDFAFAYPARTAIDRWREQRPIRRGVERAARILTISRWSRAAIAKRFGLDADKIGIIPLAPDPFFCLGDEPPSQGGPFVLAVGTREARKNTPFLVDIFARAFPGGDVRLVVVGELDLTSRAALNAASVPFEVRSHVDDAALRRLYRTAAAVAVPSLAEGFGLVAAEAQACGAPVVAANAAALPETVEDGGILIDPRDADGWTAALREVVRNDALNTLYRTAALGRWSGAAMQQTAPAVLALLQSAVDNPA